ncbi:MULTISPECIES: hypothetical protein [Pseudoalteromonas]|uniref:hypothetical protein n=1 Tax=Pseudoalteromonas TaxID=53246 RepID=UPI000FFEED4C|nr:MULTISPECIES: hypothetical protein [Pseudoalteromonas]MCG9760954.1 hypothetical protein [Pseudoalteromonas sp. Isolate6]NKC20391.1 hypothetical protein [Pseudoalteromonas galatheae]RXE86211.1 hypothetical protein DRB05_12365 [Pseudoalteromonas sp. A757]
MKLQLNKKNIKALSNDGKSVPVEMTPQVVGGDMQALSPAGSNRCTYIECWTGKARSCYEHTCQMP